MSRKEIDRETNKIGLQYVHYEQKNLKIFQPCLDLVPNINENM